MKLYATRFVFFLLLLSLSLQASAWEDKFRQMEEEWPTPTVYRTASGAPGVQYWQQRADYRIRVRLDDRKQEIQGEERITYYNQSPDTLHYLWLQLDNNRLQPRSAGNLARPAPDLDDEPSYKALRGLLAAQTFDGSLKIQWVKDGQGKPLQHVIVDTMMRVDLPHPLKPGESTQLQLKWHYKINDGTVIRARTGYEYFKEDDNYIYEIAHWYPRMAVYNDVRGWQNKNFIGSGEFTLEFGNFDVEITVPADHVVAATGKLVNANEVLTAKQQKRLEKARKSTHPVYIIKPEEARENEKHHARKEKTWHFVAENVRDFAFASSRKFIWDAMGHDSQGNPVLAMSFYPNEAEPLWSRYSTQAIVHTMEVYSRYTIPYPWPVAISVNGPVGGMEYPMISFNKPRPVEDGTYFGETVEGKWWEYTKYGLISVIIHEVGHNYFPMMINSDERQWTWMDEGLNTFVQFLAEQEWEEDYPSRRGEARDITDYMLSRRQVPIMTNSESLMQFGNNAYAKPATALNILRETILGRELFDYAFRTYAMRWQFRHPEPSDFFRTMEDASGVDLDWFWRGWFYSTDHVDIAITGVEEWDLDTLNPDTEKAKLKKERDEEPESRTRQRNRGIKKRVERFPELQDFYNEYDELDVTASDRKEYKETLQELDDWEKKLLKTEQRFFVLEFENRGGLVMPVILRLTWDNGQQEEMTLPAEIWRYNPRKVRKLLVSKNELVKVEVDPYKETADANMENNQWPPRIIKSRFQLHKEKRPDNPMQQAREEKHENRDSN